MNKKYKIAVSTIGFIFVFFVADLFQISSMAITYPEIHSFTADKYEAMTNEEIEFTWDARYYFELYINFGDGIGLEKISIFWIIKYFRHWVKYEKEVI